MKTKNTFYVTTPIYYTNASPHIGSAYTTIAADVLARWNRIQGKEVFFLTGTDEHGQKIQETAEKAGKSPKEFVDSIVKEFKEAFQLLNISNNNFIRTTDKYHEKEVQEILQKLYDKKYIYKGFYEAYYCVGCEQYKTESELIDGKCPLHNREPELRKEEAYLFKLSQFQDKLLKAIKKEEMNILPVERRKEMITFIEEGLKDISISRLKEKIYWGIELPFDKKHSCFVWVDAFWNYISGLKTEQNKEKFWPANVQLMAKDIIRVHSTIWAALLLALGYKLPKTMFVHGYFTINGQKMSKSLGNVISPIYLANKYQADSVRYYLMRNMPFGNDGDVSEKALVDRHNSELANKLGNLVSRVSALAEKYGIEKSKLSLDSKSIQSKVAKHIENYELDKALNEIFTFIDRTNEYVQEKKPWETQSKKVLYELSNAIKDIAILLYPFMPETSEKISKIFNFEISKKSLDSELKVSKINKAQILFQKIETMAKTTTKVDNPKAIKASETKAVKELTPEKPANGTTKISYDEFAKVEMKVGKILKAEDHPKADKLLVLHVDFETEKRTIVAGLRLHYKKEELVGKKAIFVTNLQPANLRGIESNGMILAAVNEDDEHVVFLTPEKDIEVGSKIR